jgi:small subunit ribosomal protein S9
MEVTNTIGRRKSAVARVYLTPGKGNITINNRPFEEYFTTDILQYVVKQPLTLLGLVGNYDIKANLDGGGFTGQAEALRLGIARALMEIDPECRPKLKQAGFVTRDPREVERKKPGRPKARKRFQFSKR